MDTDALLSASVPVTGELLIALKVLGFGGRLCRRCWAVDEDTSPPVAGADGGSPGDNEDGGGICVDIGMTGGLGRNPGGGGRGG